MPILSAEEKAAMLEIAVNAAGMGHDLGGFEPVQDEDGNPTGYQARCRKCDMTAWVGNDGLRYSLLALECGTQSHTCDKHN